MQRCRHHHHCKIHTYGERYRLVSLLSHSSLSVYSQIPASLSPTWEQHWTHCQLTSGQCLVVDCVSHCPSWSRSSLSSLVLRRGNMRSSEYITPNIHTQHGCWSQMLSTGVVGYLKISSSTMFLTDSSPCSPLVSLSPHLNSYWKFLGFQISGMLH